MHIFPIIYDEKLPFYYNNNQQFLQKRLDSRIIKKSKLFEKAEIKWVCVDDIIKMRPKFRSYFQNIIDMIYAEKNDIKNFISISLKKDTKKKTLKRR
jgi:transcription termination factor NusB